MTAEPQDRPTMGEIQNRIIHLKDLLKKTNSIQAFDPSSSDSLLKGRWLADSLMEAAELERRMQDLMDGGDSA